MAYNLKISGLCYNASNSLSQDKKLCNNGGHSYHCHTHNIEISETGTDGDVTDSSRRCFAVVPDTQHRQFNRLIKDHVHSVHLSHTAPHTTSTTRRDTSTAHGALILLLTMIRTVYTMSMCLCKFTWFSLIKQTQHCNPHNNSTTTWSTPITTIYYYYSAWQLKHVLVSQIGSVKLSAHQRSPVKSVLLTTWQPLWYIASPAVYAHSYTHTDNLSMTDVTFNW